MARNSDGGLEAWVTVSAMDAGGELQQCEVIVDTGFTGWLVLPEAEIRRLGLVRAGSQYSIIASGSGAEFEYYETSGVVARSAA